MADKKKGRGGKPPVEHQFKKGQSGNPGGRPKRPPSLRDTAVERLERQVWITVESQRMRVPLREAIIDKILASLNADEFFKLAKWLEGEAPPRTVEDPDLEAADEDDAAILTAAVERAIARRSATEAGDA